MCFLASEASIPLVARRAIDAPHIVRHDLHACGLHTKRREEPFPLIPLCLDQATMFQLPLEKTSRRAHRMFMRGSRNDITGVPPSKRTRPSLTHSDVDGIWPSDLTSVVSPLRAQDTHSTMNALSSMPSDPPGGMTPTS